MPSGARASPLSHYCVLSPKNRSQNRNHISQLPCPAVPERGSKKILTGNDVPTHGIVHRALAPADGCNVTEQHVALSLVRPDRACEAAPNSCVDLDPGEDDCGDVGAGTHADAGADGSEAGHLGLAGPRSCGGTLRNGNIVAERAMRTLYRCVKCIIMAPMILSSVSSIVCACPKQKTFVVDLKTIVSEDIGGSQEYSAHIIPFYGHRDKWG